MKPKNRLAIILGIIFFIFLIATLLVLAIVFDYKLKGWMLGFVLPIFSILFIAFIVFLIARLRKIRREPEKLIKEINPKDAEALLQDILVTRYGTNFIPNGQRIMNIGTANAEKTPIIYKWGKCDYGNPEFNGLNAHLMMNLKEPSKFNIILKDKLDYIDINESIQALAENPKIEETYEDIISSDELGRPVRKRITKRQTREQKEKEIEEKEIEEKEAL